MKKVYINGIGGVSVQNSQLGLDIESFVPITQAINYAQHPSYKEMIAPAMLRRMAKGVKMGIYSAQQALDQAQVTMPDAVITGTGMGCLEDSEKFLRSLLENHEQFLTPTSFIQSTHNTVGAQIALRLQCKGYNFTYVHASVSFESALLDAFLQIQNEELNNSLVGGIDEISDYTLSLLQLTELVNTDFDKPFKEGVNIGEGATFFCLQNQKTDATYAEVVDVWMQHKFEKTSFNQGLQQFLEANQRTAEDIDVLILGDNQMLESKDYFDQIERALPWADLVHYKHLTGEYDTVSAFGVLLGAVIVKNQDIPKSVLTAKKKTGLIKNVLIYNHLRGEDHSLILLEKC